MSQILDAETETHILLAYDQFCFTNIKALCSSVRSSLRGRRGLKPRCGQRAASAESFWAVLRDGSAEHAAEDPGAEARGALRVEASQGLPRRVRKWRS